jgi:predicted dehydrogenase
MNAAVIGVGRMGRRHVQVARELGLSVTAIVDRSAETLASARAELSIREGDAFTDVAPMLAAKKPEVVIVATTAPTHADFTVAAAKAGAKFILCEKPMATSLADCDRMLEACRASGTKLAINHQMRFMEQYTRPKALLESEELGGLTSIAVVAGNFGLAMNGSHYVEMFRTMTGQAPASVSAWFSKETVSNPRGAEFVDRAGSLRIEAADGRRMTMDIGADQGHGMHVLYGARFGQVFVDELTGFLRVQARNPEHRALPTTRYGMPHATRTEQIEPADALAPTRSVLKALLDGKSFPSGEDGRLAVATLVAAYLSDERGHVPVPVDGALPRDRSFPWA